MWWEVTYVPSLAALLVLLLHVPTTKGQGLKRAMDLDFTQEKRLI